MTWNKNTIATFVVGAVAATLGHAACDSDSTTSSTSSTSSVGPGATTASSGTSSSSTAAATGGGGQGQGGAGGSGGHAMGGSAQGGTGGALVGCANDPYLCPPNWECCEGIPYDPAGECHPMCNMQSDRAAKHAIEPVDGDAVLARLASMPVSRWRYDADPGVVHMGPMAQDFRAAFGLGDSERHITTVDANGVALAAIQALHRRMEALEAELSACQGTAAATPLPSTRR